MRLTTYEPVEGGIPYVTVKDEQDALQKLAAYEDAEEQGQLVRLPFKVGDTFYYFSETMHGELYVASSKVIQIVMTDRALIVVDGDGCYHYDYWFTRAEAKTALKGETERCMRIW